MKKSTKTNFAKATSELIKRLADGFNVRAIDVWQSKDLGANITFSTPLFCNTIDVCSEVGLYIAIAKNRGYINNGSVSTENDTIKVLLF